MALTACAKCGQHQFEIKEVSPLGGQYKHIAIQCTSCGTPIGITTYNNTSVEIKGVMSALSDIEKSIKRLGSEIQEIKNAMRRQ